jgi:hypothetical protein
MVEQEFWKGYRLIEEALSYSERKFAASASIRYKATEGIGKCFEAFDAAASEMCRKLGMNAIGKFDSKVLALAQRGELAPQLASDVIDVMKQVQKAKRNKDWKMLYGMLVRVMEVLEAAFMAVS